MSKWTKSRCQYASVANWFLCVFYVSLHGRQMTKSIQHFIEYSLTCKSNDSNQFQMQENTRCRTVEDDGDVNEPRNLFFAQIWWITLCNIVQHSMCMRNAHQPHQKEMSKTKCEMRNDNSRTIDVDQCWDSNTYRHEERTDDRIVIQANCNHRRNWRNHATLESKYI